MAHFAEIDENNKVVRVLVVDDMYENDGNVFLSETLGLGGTWVKTSYNTKGGIHLNGGTPLHKNYAGPGYTFDGIGFYPPKPYESWVFNEETYLWDAPIPKPEGAYVWNEENQTWDEVIV